MPMERHRYPNDWERIATEKKESVGWVCEVCGKQCRKPGEPFDTHKRTLTVAHMNHTPEDCRPENLKAMCAVCHLKHDAKHHAETRKRRKDGDGEISEKCRKENRKRYEYSQHEMTRSIFVDRPNVHVAIGLLPSEFTSDDDD